MKKKMKDIWYRRSGWLLLLGIPLAVVVIGLAIGQAAPNKTPHRTEAAPPAESDVTFDMEVNQTYTAEDGVVVIPASEQPGKSQAKPVEHLPNPDQAWEDYAALSTPGYPLPEDAGWP